MSYDFVNEAGIGKRIEELRQQKNVSAREMSLSLGQSQSYINKIENGISLPSMQMIFEICDYLEVSVAEFFSVFNSGGYAVKSEETRKIVRLCEKASDAVVNAVYVLLADKEVNRW